jgi:ribonucleoside-diphosphate reductase alpha chain
MSVANTGSASSKIHIERMFVKEGQDPFSTVQWKTIDAVIVDANGKEKFRQDGVEVPAWWNETTINIVAEKYFRMVDGVKENSARQMFHRVAFWLALNGVRQGVFEGEVGALDTGKPVFRSDSATAFYDELIYMGLHGMHAFNSPVWFNVGAVAEPQCSACFIQSAKDTMSDIMDLAKREVMLFKGGSGTGSNLSPIRSSWEKISRGGRPSGPVSFMKGHDAFAGVTKSGGTTRRAAKMVTLNIDHPDILEQRNGEPGFITCKAAAEKVAHDLYSTGKYTAEWNIPGNVYDLVGYQNANNSVRVTDEFMRAVEQNADWVTKEIKTGKPVKTYKARDLWKAIAEAAWFCGDPGLQFDTTTNEWHTSKASGRINASNPCSEYLYLDDTACNLSSINVLAFADGKKFKVREFSHACELAITAKEIIVDASSYPSPRLADNSHKYRTLGLGYTNVGALLTYWGIPYDSNEGRSVIAGITAVMGGAAYAQSGRLAEVVGPFPAYEENKSSMLEVMQSTTTRQRRSRRC